MDIDAVVRDIDAVVMDIDAVALLNKALSMCRITGEHYVCAINELKLQISDILGIMLRNRNKCYILSY